MRVLSFITLGVLVLAGVAAAAELSANGASGEKLENLSDYLRYAAMHNAGLKASFERFRAATEAVPQAKTLPDPKFTYSYFIEEIETRVGPQKQKFGISQTFPWFGEIEARTDAASLAAKAARQRYESDKLKLFYEVKDTYFEYAYLKHAIETTKESLELLEHFEEVARTRYATSAGGHPDVIRAQIELATLANQLESLRRFKEPIAVRLNSVLNRKSKQVLPWPDSIEYDASEIDQKQIFAQLRSNNPELKSLDFEVAVARELVEIARKRFYPDITLGVDWIDTGQAVNRGVSGSGRDAVAAMLSINLPIWSGSYKAGERQSKANLRGAAAKRVDAENEIVSRAARVLYAAGDSARKVRLYGGVLIPKAKEMLGASEAAYRGGEVDFLSLVDAQRKLLEFELAHKRAVTTAMQRRAELEMLIGSQIRANTGLKSLKIVK